MSGSFVTPWPVAFQAPLSMGFPRQEYWSVVLFPSPLSKITYVKHIKECLIHFRYKVKCYFSLTNNYIDINITYS